MVLLFVGIFETAFVTFYNYQCRIARVQTPPTVTQEKIGRRDDCESPYGRNVGESLSLVVMLMP